MSHSPILQKSPNKENIEVRFDKDLKSPKKTSNKRIAQSPMTPSLAQSTIRRRIDYTTKDLSYDSLLWQISFDGWKLKKQLERNQEIKKFRELELEFGEE